jgi:hypothetical protein
MMGRRQGGQGQFFYSFDLDKVVPPDHLARQIDGVLDLGWVHKELTPYYSHTGRPSIDPVLMIRMLIVGYVFAIRSERRLCAEVQVNLAYRWFETVGGCQIFWPRYFRADRGGFCLILSRGSRDRRLRARIPPDVRRRRHRAQKGRRAPISRVCRRSADHP